MNISDHEMARRKLKAQQCPACQRELEDGEQVYACELCEQDCCTACSDTTAKHAVVCEECLDGRDP